jgi:hypothetical protein
MFKLAKYILCSLFVLAATSLVLPSYAAKGGPYNKYKVTKKIKNKNVNYKAQKPNKLSKFNYNDRNVITNYFNIHPYKTKPLPPGIAKNLVRGKPLPPGIAKRYLPKNLRLQLPEKLGYDYLIAGNDVLLVDKTTNIIADIISNILK